MSTVSSNGVPENGMKVEFKISSLENTDDKRAVNVSSAWVIKELEIPLKHTKILKNVDRWPHLKEVPFPQVERKKISLLIGTGVQEAFVPLEIRQGKSDEPFAIRTILGWSVTRWSPPGKTNVKVRAPITSAEQTLL